MNPSFTALKAQREMFSSIWVLYIADSGSFHDNAIPLVTEHSRATDFFSQGAQPENCFDASSLAWASFTGFNLNPHEGWDRLAPFFAIGRYFKEKSATWCPWRSRCTMPLSMAFTSLVWSTTCRACSRIPHGLVVPPVDAP
ncbi:CatA-like O-acetyltransferase [Actinomycetaceae bacterium L2_0104]